jgi:hypothetical protein
VFTTFQDLYSEDLNTKINDIPVPLVDWVDCAITEFDNFALAEMVRYAQYINCEPLRKLASASLAVRLRGKSEDELIQFFS